MTAATPTTTTISSSSSPTSSSSPATPAHIFIIRHGARLDAADRDWTLSSPTPYDTPLTYGGWIQSRHLGTRIASLLHDAAAAKEPGRNKKRTRVVIHSSPFLRCIQTSVSIASGLAQHHHQQAIDAYCERGVAAERFVKPVLRLDAWLSEWLLPDYYADITPPPPSLLMVGTARDEYLRAPVGMLAGSSAKQPPPPPPPQQQQQQHHDQCHDETTLPTSLTGGFVPPSPNYAVSNSGMIPKGYVSQAKELLNFDFAWDSLRLGEGGELGEGWNSMFMRFYSGYKRLLCWYGASKPSVATASTASLAARSTATTSTTTATTTTTITTAPPSTTTTTVTATPSSSSTATDITTAPFSPSSSGNPTPPLPEPGPEHDGDQDVETVVILVTHGGGCNALLGAITNKPVLIDVGICSVSWGVLRPSSSPPSLPPPLAAPSRRPPRRCRRRCRRPRPCHATT